MIKLSLSVYAMSLDFWDDSLLDLLKCQSLVILDIDEESMSDKVAAALTYLID